MEKTVIVSKGETNDPVAHEKDCRWVNNILPGNRREITVSQAKREGYKPCDDCCPWR